MTSKAASTDLGDPITRKERGAFFTPRALSDFLCRWAIVSSTDRVLEPSCGDGSFLLAAAERLAGLGCPPTALDLTGHDIHADSVSASLDMLTREGYRADLRTADFFDVATDRSYDAVVGNPPFVRYQDFSGDARVRGRAAALRAGVGLTALASSWAAFVVHAAQFLRPGGRLGLVLPAELLTVNYAAAVRSHLLASFHSVRVVVFAERVFPDVLEEVVLLLADGAGHPGGTDHFDLQQATDLTDLITHEVTPSAPRRFTPVRAADKWSAAFVSDSAAEVYARLLTTGAFTHLQTWGETTLGSVTGDNDYFTLTPAEAAALGLHADETTSISPPGSRHLRGLSLTAASWTALGAAGKRTMLFRPGTDQDRMSPAARRRIHEGERADVHTGYKCSHRTPWWQVPLVATPDLFLTYMNADTPRLTTNTARVRHLNSVHGVYLSGEVRGLGRSLLPLASLNSATMLGAEIVGRAYGGGILKLEPREADRLPVPSPALVDAHATALAAARPQVRAALKRGGPHAAALIVDDVLLSAADCAPTERAFLVDAQRQLAHRRTTRSGRP